MHKHHIHTHNLWKWIFSCQRHMSQVGGSVGSLSLSTSSYNQSTLVPSAAAAISRSNLKTLSGLELGQVGVYDPSLETGLRKGLWKCWVWVGAVLEASTEGGIEVKGGRKCALGLQSRMRQSDTQHRSWEYEQAIKENIFHWLV